MSLSFLVFHLDLVKADLLADDVLDLSFLLESQPLDCFLLLFDVSGCLPRRVQDASELRFSVLQFVSRHHGTCVTSWVLVESRGSNWRSCAIYLLRQVPLAGSVRRGHDSVGGKVAVGYFVSLFCIHNVYQVARTLRGEHGAVHFLLLRIEYNVASFLQTKVVRIKLNLPRWSCASFSAWSSGSGHTWGRPVQWVSFVSFPSSADFGEPRNRRRRPVQKAWCPGWPWLLRSLVNRWFASRTCSNLRTDRCPRLTLCCSGPPTYQSPVRSLSQMARWVLHPLLLWSY